MNKRRSKPRIALFGVGTLGGGSSGQGIPVLTDLFERLSEHFEIVFYSFTRVRKANIPKVILVRQIISIRFPWRLKYLLLFIRVLMDHFSRPYSLIFSVSAYPSGLFAVMTGKILHKPVLVQLIASEAANLEDIGFGHLTPQWVKRISKFVCLKADILVTVADYQKKLALISLPTLRPIDVLPLRVNPANFIYRKRTVSYPVHFIQVAYYSPIKDQDTMFEAFSIVAKKIDCRLTVIGNGFNSPNVNAMLKNLNIEDKVNCVGFIRQAELPGYYDKAHILLHTARFETGCAVIQEAMASGVAVCGTNVGLLADIGDRYAVVVPPRDPVQLAEGILNLVNDTQRYEQMTLEAHQWITQNDAAWSGRNYHHFIEGILAKNSR